MSDEREVSERHVSGPVEMTAAVPDKWKVKVMWSLLIAALVAAGGSTMAVVSWLRESGQHELEFRQLLEHDADHERRLRAIERSLDRHWRGLDSPDPSGIGSGP